MGQIEFSEVQGCENVIGSLLIMKLDFQKGPTRNLLKGKWLEDGQNLRNW